VPLPPHDRWCGFRITVWVQVHRAPQLCDIDSNPVDARAQSVNASVYLPQSPADEHECN
jgi:hypothetical protein